VNFTYVLLKPHWQLMGALEALNGTLLFGLTTAFLFAVIREVWILSARSFGACTEHLGMGNHNRLQARRLDAWCAILEA
jgi:hypothetical protein